MEQVEKPVKGNDIWATAVVSFAIQKDGTTVPQIIQSTLDSFQDVFQYPQTLPPHRAFDHAISLLPGSIPVNSRPYRYSPQQKDEIERQVNKMIEAGLVTTSMSPFASLVLLVKKKDGTWRFCVDYRRRNTRGGAAWDDPDACKKNYSLNYHLNRCCVHQVSRPIVHLAVHYCEVHQGNCYSSSAPAQHHNSEKQISPANSG